MDYGVTEPIPLQTPPPTTWFWFFIITIIFGALWYGMNTIVDIEEVRKNWPKYRCSPTIMPFASLYGYNVNENFTYCMSNMFNAQVGQTTGPFKTILSSMLGGMTSFIQSLNSLRVMFATLVGGMQKIIYEFGQRMRLIYAQLRMTMLRMQVLFKRVFATFYSVIYMGLSVITTGGNFSDSIIFRFLDTFCFAPETEIRLINGETKKIKDVVLGDILEGGERVTSTYRFMSDGQPMVRLGDIIVSTNHFVEYNGTLIDASKHPDAIPIEDWNGGVERPLICLDTDVHRIPICNYVFSDWDETSESDRATMLMAERILNGSRVMDGDRDWLYQPALDPKMKVLGKDAIYSIEELQLGTQLKSGKIIGLGKRAVKDVCMLPSRYYVTPSQLVWRDDMWVRAGHLYPIEEKEMTLTTIVIAWSGCVETEEGITLRDMCEVFSPDLEGPTRDTLQG